MASFGSETKAENDKTDANGHITATENSDNFVARSFELGVIGPNEDIPGAIGSD